MQTCTNASRCRHDRVRVSWREQRSRHSGHSVGAPARSATNTCTEWSSVEMSTSTTSHGGSRPRSLAYRSRSCIRGCYPDPRQSSTGVEISHLKPRSASFLPWLAGTGWRTAHAVRRLARTRHCSSPPRRCRGPLVRVWRAPPEVLRFEANLLCKQLGCESFIRVDRDLATASAARRAPAIFLLPFDDGPLAGFLDAAGWIMAGGAVFILVLPSIFRGFCAPCSASSRTLCQLHSCSSGASLACWPESP